MYLQIPFKYMHACIGLDRDLLVPLLFLDRFTALHVKVQMSNIELSSQHVYVWASDFRNTWEDPVA
jgi:hypothetical protein